MTWIYEKFKGDGAIYATCPDCKFTFNCSRLNHTTMLADICINYNYCPMCGKHLENNEENVEVIWYERDITELYN